MAIHPMTEGEIDIIYVSELERELSNIKDKLEKIEKKKMSLIYTGLYWELRDSGGLLATDSRLWGILSKV